MPRGRAGTSPPDFVPMTRVKPSPPGSNGGEGAVPNGSSAGRWMGQLGAAVPGTAQPGTQDPRTLPGCLEVDRPLAPDAEVPLPAGNCVGQGCPAKPPCGWSITRPISCTRSTSGRRFRTLSSGATRSHFPNSRTPVSASPAASGSPGHPLRTSSAESAVGFPSRLVAF